MSKFAWLFQVLSLIVFSLALWGCNHFSKELFQSNHRFEGHLIAGSFPGEFQLLPNERFEMNLTPQQDSKSLSITAINFKGKILFEGLLSLKKLGTLSLELPYEEGAHTLKKSDLNINRPGMTHCFTGRKKLSISLCLSERDFSFVVSEETGKTKLQLHGGLASQADLKLEEPRPITLTMAMDRALNKNFQSHYDFETTIQAHNTSMAALLNLMPHFRFMNGVGIYTMAMPVLISSIGDWAPFLVPSRWFKGIESRSQDFASRLGFQVLQANLAQQVQMLGLVFKHDQIKLDHIKNTQSAVNEVQSILKTNFSENEEDPAILSVDAFREALDLAESQMNAVIGGDRAALSLALGYFNPQAVEDLQIDVPFISIDEPKTYSSEQLALNAIDLSLELQQLQFVKDSLRTKKVSLALNWLDPSGSPDTALGFNLIPQFANIRSEIRQIELKADMIRQQIHQVSQAIERSTARAKVNFKEINDTLNSEDRKTQRLLARIHQEQNSTSKNVSLFEISVNEVVKSLKTVLELKFEKESALLNWELGQVREERLLFMQRPRFLIGHNFQ